MQSRNYKTVATQGNTQNDFNLRQYASSAMAKSEKKGDTLGIDFTFNTIKNVKKVSWKEEAPWYREILDGFCWLGYCHNTNMKQELYVKAEMRARFGKDGHERMDL